MHDWLDYNCPSWDYCVDPNRTGLNQRLPKDPAVRDPFYVKRTQEITLGYPNKNLMAHVHILVNKRDSIILQMFHDAVLITTALEYIPSTQPMVFG